MKRLDLVSNDLVLTKDDRLCEVVAHNKENIILSEQVRNGFGHVLWRESPFIVFPNGRFYENGLPSNNDIDCKVKIKYTLFGFKYITSDLSYVE